MKILVEVNSRLMTDETSGIIKKEESEAFQYNYGIFAESGCAKNNQKIVFFNKGLYLQIRPPVLAFYSPHKNRGDL